LCLTDSAVIPVSVHVIYMTYIPTLSRMYSVIERISSSFYKTVSWLLGMIGNLVCDLNPIFFTPFLKMCCTQVHADPTFYLHYNLSIQQSVLNSLYFCQCCTLFQKFIIFITCFCNLNVPLHSLSPHQKNKPHLKWA
jgi:hypothetical protein